MPDIILASKSKVRLHILNKNNVVCSAKPSNVDEDEIKVAMLRDGASPKDISKNLAEIKANKVSQNNLDKIVIGADSVIDLENEIISKPKNRSEALEILKKLNGKTHYLISSVCISKDGNMIWNYTDKAKLTMKEFSLEEFKDYLGKVSDEALYAYNVYQIEGIGSSLFSKIEGDKNTIMGLPVQKIKNYLNNHY